MISEKKYIVIKTKGVNNINRASGVSASAVIETLNITPERTPQTIIAPEGVDGYNPVNVAGVNASIDSNITAGNIKYGVTILGVTGNYQGTSPVINALEITPSTSQQVITASGGIGGYSPITVNAVTSDIDANISAGNIKSGVSILGVAGSVVELKGDTLSVTPTTSEQNFTPISPINGYTSVTVSAVTSAIDSNIAAGNIKSGVSILGVAGNVTELNGSTITINPSTSEQTAYPVSPSNGFTSVTVPAVTSAIDSNITQGNIKSGVTILGVTGNYSKVIDPLSITPTTSQQTITASGGVDGYSPITVNAVTSSIDANITAGNIKSGVSILGVTGTAKIAPDYYVEKSNSSGTLYNGNTIIDLTGITDLGVYALAGSYGLVNFGTGNTDIDFSGLTGVSQRRALYRTFCNSNITSLDLSGLITIGGSGVTAGNGDYACESMCEYCSGLTSVNLSNLEEINAQGCCYCMFDDCTNLISIDLGSLVSINSSDACMYMFSDCTSLASVDFSSLTTMGANTTTCCSYMFKGCTSLTSVNFPVLSVMGGGCCVGMFQGTNISSISFPAVTTSSFGGGISQFRDIVRNVTGCTIHFPSNLQTTISGMLGYPSFGGTNTTILFDLPATS